jgi:DNA-binding protein HU-beta
MNRHELVAEVAAQLDKSRAEIGRTVEAVLDAIGAALARNDEVRLTGFGTFWVKTTPARSGRNPQTGATLQIAEKRAPRFKPGKVLGNAIANGGGRRAA